MGKGNIKRPLIVIGSLIASIVCFTLLLKATTTLIGVPQSFWQILAGGIMILMGLHYLGLPIWEKITGWLHLSFKANKRLSKATKEKGEWGAVLTGAALGPVFASCSPTFAFVIAAVIPADFILGLIYLTTYAVGMGFALLAVVYLGRVVIMKLRIVNDPKSWLARTIGILFISIGVLIATGVDKQLQTFVLEQGWYDPITSLESRLTPQ